MSDRFDHVHITTRDLAASLAFYRDVLGWTVIDERPHHAGGRGAVLTGGGMKVVLSERDPVGAHTTDPRPNVHLDIHDIDARFRELPKGAHVLIPPQPTGWGTRWFVVRDPDGNVIAFEEFRERRD